MHKCDFKEDIYIRPLAYKSTEALGVRLHDLKNDFLLFAIPWGTLPGYRYLPLLRFLVAPSHDNVIPAGVKSTGIYINNAFTKTEAIENGYDEGIMLTPDGHVAEARAKTSF